MKYTCDDNNLQMNDGYGLFVSIYTMNEAINFAYFTSSTIQCLGNTQRVSLNIIRFSDFVYVPFHFTPIDPLPSVYSFSYIYTYTTIIIITLGREIV